MSATGSHHGWTLHLLTACGTAAPLWPSAVSWTQIRGAALISATVFAGGFSKRSRVLHSDFFPDNLAMKGNLGAAGDTNLLKTGPSASALKGAKHFYTPQSSLSTSKDWKLGCQRVWLRHSWNTCLLLLQQSCSPKVTTSWVLYLTTSPREIISKQLNWCSPEPSRSTACKSGHVFKVCKIDPESHLSSHK